MRYAAFTIVELLIVIVVIAILATIAVIAYNGIQNRARESTVKSDLSQAGKQLVIDKTLNGSYPATVNPDGSGDANDGGGLGVSNGTSYQYSVNNATNPSTFCLSATNGNQVYHVTNGGIPEKGACPGHSGVATGDGSSVSCGTGFAAVPGNSQFGTSDFCVAKYEAKNVGGTATSQATGTPWVNITQPDAITAANNACAGCHLITEAEWLTVAHDVLNVSSNWSGGSVGSGYIYSGHNDNNPATVLAAGASDSDGYYGTGSTSGTQRRTLTLSNGEVIWDLAGNTEEWTTGQTSGGQPGPGSLAYRDWNSIEGTGSLSPSPFPSYGTPAASNWTAGNGMGRVYSNSADMALRAFLRGGRRNHGTNAGIFALALDDGPIHLRDYVGFRLAR